MYPRVSSYAAICGRNPVASIGQRATGVPAPREKERPAPVEDADLGAIPAEQPLKDQGDAIDAIDALE